MFTVKLNRSLKGAVPHPLLRSEKASNGVTIVPAGAARQTEPEK
jgi:hypothetical protein